MNHIQIGDKRLAVKDYYCSLWGTDTYIKMDRPKLWLYVNVTDACPAQCPFCVNPSEAKASENKFNVQKYAGVLKMLLPDIKGISLTGGEPLLDLDLFMKILEVTADITQSSIEIDTVTNGIHLKKLCDAKEALKLTSIHISRHSVDDMVNRQIFRQNVPCEDELRNIIAKYPDPGAFVFNCVMQKHGVHDLEGISSYLEMAARIGVRNSSFIAMIKANDYCKENYVSPSELNFAVDERFTIWNRQQDYEYCSCCTGDYKAVNGYTGFYYRMPDQTCSHYARQIVYTADNRLLEGFNGEEIRL